MMRNSTSAIPSDRIQLSNQRARRDRRGSGGVRTGAGRALVPAVGTPNSCMPVTLAKLSRRRNSTDPSRGPASGVGGPGSRGGGAAGRSVGGATGGGDPPPDPRNRPSARRVTPRTPPPPPQSIPPLPPPSP